MRDHKYITTATDTNDRTHDVATFVASDNRLVISFGAPCEYYVDDMSRNRLTNPKRYEGKELCVYAHGNPASEIKFSVEETERIYALVHELAAA